MKTIIELANDLADLRVMAARGQCVTSDEVADAYKALEKAIAAARVAAISTLKLCDPDALGLEQGDDCATGVYRVEKAIRALIGGSK